MKRGGGGNMNESMREERRKESMGEGGEGGEKRENIKKII